jgi:hypothetical protein
MEELQRNVRPNSILQGAYKLHRKTFKYALAVPITAKYIKRANYVACSGSIEKANRGWW